MRVRLAEVAAAPRPSADTAHGVVAWARSPRIVADPVEHCRPTERSIIGDRSCASSSTTWPRLGVRSSRSAASSISTASCSDHLARRPGPSAASPRRSRACSSSSRMPSAALGQEVRRRRAAASPAACGSTAGQSASTYCLDRPAAGHRVLHPVVGGVAGQLHLDQDRVREPLRQHRPAGAVPDAAGAQLRHDLVGLVRRAPATGARRIGTTRPSAAGATCDHSARASTSAIRASPLTRAAVDGVDRPDRHGATSSSTVVCLASISPRAGSTSPM